MLPAFMSMCVRLAPSEENNNGNSVSAAFDRNQAGARFTSSEKKENIHTCPKKPQKKKDGKTQRPCKLIKKKKRGEICRIPWRPC